MDGTGSRSEAAVAVSPGQEYLCKGPRPISIDPCALSQCAESRFDVTYADIKRARSGVPVTAVIPAGEAGFYVFERPSAAVRGVCIVADSDRAELSTGTCSVVQRRTLQECQAGFRACMEVAKLGAGAAETQTTPCECYNTTMQCIRSFICSTEAVNLLEYVGDACMRECSSQFAAQNCSSANYVFSAGAAESPPIDIYVSVGSIIQQQNTNPQTPSKGELVQLPVSTQTSIWQHSQSLISEPDVRMLIWDDPRFNRTVDHLTLGVKAAATQAHITLTVTALTHYPASLSGSASAGLTAAKIRQGGETIEIVLSCDLFRVPRSDLKFWMSRH